jgi:hypothetical protein
VETGLTAIVQPDPIGASRDQAIINHQAARRPVDRAVNYNCLALVTPAKFLLKNNGAC